MRNAVLRRLPFALALVLAASFARAASPAEVEDLVKKRDPSALSQAEALVKAQEGNAAAWIVLTRAQLQKGMADDAIDSAEEAVELAPQNAQAHYWLGNSYGMRIGQVNMLRKMAMAPDLRDAFETAVRLDPNLIDARNALIQYYLQAPAAVGGGLDKAKAQQAEIARRNPARGHLAQATIDRSQGDMAAVWASIDAAAAAVALDDAPTRLNIALFQQGLERWESARIFLQDWTAKQPDLATPRYQLGRLAAVSGQHLAVGAEALERYLTGDLKRGENDPDDAAAWWRLGQIHAHQGRKDEARTAFTTALRLDPANEEAKKSLQAL